MWKPLFHVALLGTAALSGGCASEDPSPIPTAGELNQIYYLGTLDTHQQVPPTIYRITIRSQHSLFNETQIAAGWVPANLIDTLNTDLQPNESSLQIVNKSSTLAPRISKVLFGPEGFREAPHDRRLVIYMGSNPEEFFTTLRSQSNLLQLSEAERALVLEELPRLQQQTDRLRKLKAEATAVEMETSK